MVDVFVDELNLAKLGFDGVIPAETASPESAGLRHPRYESVFTHPGPISAGHDRLFSAISGHRYATADGQKRSVMS